MTKELRDVVPESLLRNPFDWSKHNTHISPLPVGTTLKIWRAGKMQIAILHRKELHGEEWRICAPPRWEGAEPSYIYSEGFRYIVEHSI